MSNTNVPSPKLKALRDLAEGGLDYETAIAMAGIVDSEGARFAWRYFNRNYAD